MSGFLGMMLGMGCVPKLTGATVTDDEFDPVNASAGLTFNSDGSLTFTGNGAPGATRWYANATQGGGFTVRLTVSSGDAPTSGPATGTFHALTSNRTWLLTTTVQGSLTGSWLLEIGGNNDQVLASATFTVEANRN